MADCAVVVSGKYRKLSQVAVVKSGKYSEITEIPVVVSGKYRKSYEAFSTHIASGYYATSSQSEQTGWTVNRTRILQALAKGYNGIKCDNLQVVEGSMLWRVDITYTDWSTTSVSLVGYTSRYINIYNNIEDIRLIYQSNDGQEAAATGDFDFVQ